METVLRVQQAGPSWNHEAGEPSWNHDAGEEGFPDTETVPRPASAPWEPQASQHQNSPTIPSERGTAELLESARGSVSDQMGDGEARGLRGYDAGQVALGPQHEADSAFEPR